MQLMQPSKDVVQAEAAVRAMHYTRTKLQHVKGKRNLAILALFEYSRALF